MKAIQVTQTGGAEVLTPTEIPTPTPGSGQVLVRIEASGVNFIDIYYREGRYKIDLPFVPGQEGAGVVEEVGSGVERFRPGDRVAWADRLGSYAEFFVASSEKLVKVPENVESRLAAAVMLQGMTAHYLTHSTFRLKVGDTALVHAAAGGVGLLLTQIASQLGARVIATVSTEAKAQLAKEAGASDVILYMQTDFEAETKRLTNGRGVDVVYDSVGKVTFEKSLGSLRPRGLLALYGASSGPVPPFDPMLLSKMGSLFLTRPSLGSYIQTRQELEERANAVLNWVQGGRLKVRMEHTYPLREAAQAHRDLEGRKTTGKLVLEV
jgi:NADPH2:quinone reductase